MPTTESWLQPSDQRGRGDPVDPRQPTSVFMGAWPRVFDSPTGNPLRLPAFVVYDLTGGHTAASAAASATYREPEGGLIPADGIVRGYPLDQVHTPTPRSVAGVAWGGRIREPVGRRRGVTGLTLTEQPILNVYLQRTA